MAATKTDEILSREQLRTFHLSGIGLDESAPVRALRPSVLDNLPDLANIEALYPVCVSPDGRTQFLRQVLGELEHAAAIISAFRDAMNGRASVVLAEVANRAIPALAECGRSEIDRLKNLLPAGALLVGFHAEGLTLLHAAALAESRQREREQFWSGVRQTAARLREILRLDETHAPDAVSAESVSASLGARVDTFLNPAILAKALQRPVNPLRRMSAERRSRCQTTLSMLEEGLHDAANQPAFWLFHSGIFGSTETPEEILLFRGGARWAFDSFAAALQFCDSRLDRHTHLLRALRAARLEIDSAFDPVLHEEMLARFDWQAASAGELNALPPVVVVETAENLGQASLTSFGALLRSGRPVQIMIVQQGLQPRDLKEFTPDFGYLSIAHREAFVLQSSMAEPAHLLPGIASMAKTLRTAVAIVAAPRAADDDRAAWIEERLLVLARAFPLYCYDPDQGARWNERFQLFSPAPPPKELTAAHSAALSFALAPEFRVIPMSMWNSDQMDLYEYLDVYTTRAPLAVPYIWVEEDGERRRALLTRDLVNFCVDRRRAWALFDELSTVGKAIPVADDSARQSGAREAIGRVLALLNGQSS